MRTHMRRRAAVGAATAVVLLVTAASPLRAQQCTVRVTTAERASQWAPPLDRIVSVQLPSASVREALDRLAVIANVELSYSAELLPPDRQVCLALERVPMGAVLESLLAGSTLRPIVLGTSQVVLAPSQPPLLSAATAPVVTRRASVLDRVVVTGSPDGAAQRGSPFALDVLDGATLAQHGVTTLGEALDLAAPGVWSWTPSAGSVTGRYGSIRGASSFGVSAPKLYLDGIEVANPLLVTQLDPARIARVEVIRGPQGAALYGADAISGVINILTRYDGTDDGRAQRQVTASAGVSNTAFAPRDPLVQEHTVAFRRGSPAQSLGMGLNLGTVGAFVPGASERKLLADANGRFTRDHAVFSGTARLSLQQANASAIPALIGDGINGPRSIGDSASGQDVAHYTVGGNVAMMPTLRWTHTVIAGVDGYRVRGLSAAALPGPLSAVANTLIGDSRGAADRASLRVRSVGRYDVAPATLLTITVGAEQAFTHEVLDRPPEAAVSIGGGANAPGAGALSRPLRTQRREQTTYANSGLLAQGVMAWQDMWFLSVGARVERTTGATPLPQQSLLPMLGAAWVHETGGAVVKLRGAYGTGIRPARTLLRNASWMSAGAWGAALNLEAERQSGVEFGGDLLWGSRLSLHVTRFDQRASGLIQPVSSLATTVTRDGRLVRTMAYSLQNVGAITNRGWEIDANTRVQRLSLSGAVSLVDSRVAQLARGYRGELRIGDRMLDVPSSTMSLAAAYVVGRWTLTTGAIRAADWVSYDRAAIAEAIAESTSPSALEGPMLRRYWLSYGGMTRWRAGATYRLRSDLSMMVNGDNLLNVQTGAPDNSTVIVGRTLLMGLQAKF